MDEKLLLQIVAESKSYGKRLRKPIDIKKLRMLSNNQLQTKLLKIIRSIEDFELLLQALEDKYLTETEQKYPRQMYDKLYEAKADLCSAGRILEKIKDRKEFIKSMRAKKGAIIH